MESKYYPNRPAGAEDEWEHCPGCKFPMVTLWDYETTALADFPEFDDGHWANGLPRSGSRMFWSFVDRYFKYRARIKAVRNAKTHLLPGFPKSLICPRCLHVVQRR